MIRAEWVVETPIVNEPDIHEEMNKALGLNNIKTNNTLVLTISKECHNHIKSLHETYPHTEWLAICKTEKVWEWHFRMVDMIHPQQRWVGWEVNTTREWMKWTIDYLKEQWEDLAKWNLVLHSHHTMGCFWSQTDNNARLDMNDGRDLMWAVVTAYKNEWKKMIIDYKGCVNFYKPYNIEIDCHIEAEEDWGYEKLRKLFKKKDERDKEVGTRSKEIYKEMLSHEWIATDLSIIENYLWMDIHNELVDNYYEVCKHLPWANKEFYDNIEEIAIWQAINEIPWIDFPSELLEWNERDNKLLEQLKKAREVPQTFTSPFEWRIISGIGFKVDEKKEEEKEKEWKVEEDEEDLDEDYKFFNEKNFPDEYSLRREYQIPHYVWLSLDWNWIWMAYDRINNIETPLWEWLEDQVYDDSMYLR